jgi:YVTN family beta-propeller protein
MSASRGALWVLLLCRLGLMSFPAGAQTLIASIPVGSTPVALAINSTTNKIFAVNQNSNNITVIDGVTFGTTFVNVGHSPDAVAVNPTTNKIYVANRGDNTVSVIDGSTDTNTATVATGSAPQAVAVNPTTNKIYVVNQNSNNVTIINGTNNSIIAKIGVGSSPYAAVINTVTNKIYIANHSANGTVTVIDGQSNSVVATVSVGSFPDAVAVNSQTNRIYVVNFNDSTVSVIAGASNTNIATVPVGRYPLFLATDPVSDMIYVSNYDAGTVTAIDGTDNGITTIPVGESPAPIAVDAVTNMIYTASFLDGTVSAIDGLNDSVVATVRVGSDPEAVALDPMRNRLYVANSGDGTVSVIAGANSEPLQFVPLTPCRVADTRNPNGPFGGPPISGGTTRDFTIPASACGVPQTAAAYSLNVTVVPQGFLGYLTVWPAGEDQPTVSTLNSYDGRVKADAAIVPAGAGGAISIFAYNTTHVILDINGYFAAVKSGSTYAFFELDPCRVVDTRGPDGPLGGPFLQGGAAGRDFPITSSSCNIPATALAYSFNFTAVPRGPLGYLTTWPAGQNQPLVSTLNAPTGVTTANAAIVPAGSGGDIDVFVYNDADVVIDINGYFAAAPGGLSLYTTAPCRVLDTRNSGGMFSGTIRVNVAGSGCGMPDPSLPSAARAFVLNATVIPQGLLGYLTLWPDGSPQPLVSTLNAVDGAITSNMAIVSTTNGWIDAYALNPTQLVLDSSGYFGP